MVSEGNCKVMKNFCFNQYSVKDYDDLQTQKINIEQLFNDSLQDKQFKKKVQQKAAQIFKEYQKIFLEKAEKQLNQKNMTSLPSTGWQTDDKLLNWFIRIMFYNKKDQGITEADVIDHYQKLLETKEIPNLIQTIFDIGFEKMCSVYLVINKKLQNYLLEMYSDKMAQELIEEEKTNSKKQGKKKSKAAKSKTKQKSAKDSGNPDDLQQTSATNLTLKSHDKPDETPTLEIHRDSNSNRTHQKPETKQLGSEEHFSEEHETPPLNGCAKRKKSESTFCCSDDQQQQNHKNFCETKNTSKEIVKNIIDLVITELKIENEDEPDQLNQNSTTTHPQSTSPRDENKNHKNTKAKKKNKLKKAIQKNSEDKIYDTESLNSNEEPDTQRQKPTKQQNSAAENIDQAEQNEQQQALEEDEEDWDRINSKKKKNLKKKQKKKEIKQLNRKHNQEKTSQAPGDDQGSQNDTSLPSQQPHSSNSTDTASQRQQAQKNNQDPKQAGTKIQEDKKPNPNRNLPPPPSKDEKKQISRNTAPHPEKQPPKQDPVLPEAVVPQGGDPVDDDSFIVVGQKNKKKPATTNPSSQSGHREGQNKNKLKNGPNKHPGNPVGPQTNANTQPPAKQNDQNSKPFKIKRYQSEAEGNQKPASSPNQESANSKPSTEVAEGETRETPAESQPKSSSEPASKDPNSNTQPPRQPPQHPDLKPPGSSLPTTLSNPNHQNVSHHPNSATTSYGYQPNGDRYYQQQSSTYHSSQHESSYSENEHNQQRRKYRETAQSQHNLSNSDQKSKRGNDRELTRQGQKGYHNGRESNYPYYQPHSSQGGLPQQQHQQHQQQYQPSYYGGIANTVGTPSSKQPYYQMHGNHYQNQNQFYPYMTGVSSSLFDANWTRAQHHHNTQHMHEHTPYGGGLNGSSSGYYASGAYPKSSSQHSIHPQKIANKIFKKKVCDDIDEIAEILNVQSNKMLTIRMICSERVRFVLKKIFQEDIPDVSTRIFGSCASGLALPSSDVDISIIGVTTDQRQDIINILKRAVEVFEEFEWVTKLNPIYTASVPIIKLQIDPTIPFTQYKKTPSVKIFTQEEILRERFDDNEKYTLKTLPDLKNFQLKIDLTVETINAHDYACTHLGYYSTDLMDQWLKFYPCLHTLTILIKSLLNVRSLNVTYKGGLSSYCVLMMIIAHLREQDIGFNNDISYILLNLLNFYGNNFEPATTGINIGRDGSPFYPTQKVLDASKLQIVDPLTDNCKVITQNAYQIDRILHEFMEFHQRLIKLRREVEQVVERADESTLKKISEMTLKQQVQWLNDQISPNKKHNIIKEIIFDPKYEKNYYDLLNMREEDSEEYQQKQAEKKDEPNTQTRQTSETSSLQQSSDGPVTEEQKLNLQTQ